MRPGGGFNGYAVIPPTPTYLWTWDPDDVEGMRTQEELIAD